MSSIPCQVWQNVLIAHAAWVSVLKSEEANFSILSSGSIVYIIIIYNINIPLASIAMFYSKIKWHTFLGNYNYFILFWCIKNCISIWLVLQLFIILFSKLYDIKFLWTACHIMIKMYTDDYPPINYAKLDSTIEMFESSSPGHLVTQQSWMQLCNLQVFEASCW